MKNKILLIIILSFSLLMILYSSSLADMKNKIYWVYTDGYINIPAGATAVGGVMCDEGDVVTGGGFASSNYQVYAIDSRPIWQGWMATMYNTNTTTDLTFQVYAICLDSNMTP